MPAYCCNPFKLHTAKKRGALKISKKYFEQAQILNLNVTENDKICIQCKIEFGVLPKVAEITSQNTDGPIASTSTSIATENLVSSESSAETTDSSNTTMEVDLDKSLSNLNDSLICLGQTPIAKRKLRSQKYRKVKLQKVTNAIASKIFTEEAVEFSNNYNVCDDEKEMIEQLKAKFKNATNNEEKYLILTTLPISWSIRQIQSSFNVSFYMARRAKQLVDQRGIMVNSSKKLGSNRIDENIVHLIQDFYNDDDNSRVCAGKREYVTININGDKEKKQRRLLLFNLNEAYNIFKEKHPDIKVGFSKFASLRPQECILALDKYGTHSVCVCMHHQNVKLMFDPLLKMHIFDDSIKTYKDLLLKVICENTSENCHLNNCKNCPGDENLQQYLIPQFKKQIIDDVKFKQWVINSGKTN